ncbi:MAG: 5'-methylthioadenosine/adenosylhomocysteine nucleosidase [Lachnospiraceae bacterium]|nr:5'-methylthioadenosine/adenosylhomocysteine nucleosidase [Lachnospiraceae bacterium]
MAKIGIIGAMELEVETLKNRLEGEKITKKTGMEFHEGKLNGADVVVVRCGIGKVNAALCVQILVDIFDVTHIINTGVAGSLNAKLDIGDILISKDAVHHDMDVTPLGYKPGQVPQLDVFSFAADDEMIKLATEAVAKACPDVHSAIGRVVSGDQFISDKAVKDKLINTFAGDCAEMEGASIAHGAYLNNVPFVILRAISDKADDSAQMDYPSFEKKAAENCAKLVEEFVSLL